jgi:hypothetical protein
LNPKKERSRAEGSAVFSRLRSYRPSHGTVVAYVALFVALGGTSYAVSTGSIGSRAIKNNSIRSKDIRNSTIRGKDVKNGSLLSKDFKAGDLPAGPQGAAGPPGATGAKGATGAPGSARAYAHVLANGTLDRSRTKNVIDVRPQCPPAAVPDCTAPPPAGANAFQCYRLSFAPRSAVAIADSFVARHVTVRIPGSGSRPCPSGYQAAATTTFNPDGTTAADTGLFIVFN